MNWQRFFFFFYIYYIPFLADSSGPPAAILASTVRPSAVSCSRVNQSLLPGASVEWDVSREKFYPVLESFCCLTSQAHNSTFCAVRCERGELSPVLEFFLFSRLTTPSTFFSHFALWERSYRPITCWDFG